MEQEKRVATTGAGTFLDTAIQNLEEMKVAAQMILDSKLAPDHFYEKDEKGKPDYTKGNVASVILVCTHGHDLGLKPLVALQHVIPVNGLLSIKGDAAKTLIFKSGKLEPGSWKESRSGSLADGTLEISITAKRIDTQETMTRTFGVVHAKRAGLWVDESKIRGAEGWKWQKSAWYKYPERMITYRALGFLARDLFPDVLSGSYTTEEAYDMPVDTEIVIETPTGAELKIPDKNFSQTRSENLTKKAADLIDKRNHVEPVPEEVAKQPMTPDEAHPAPPPEDDPNVLKAEERESVATMLNGTPGFIGVFTEKELMEMETADLNTMIECDGLMQKARDVDPGKNTNKKLRTIILAHYKGEVLPLIAKFEPEDSTFQGSEPANKPITDDDIEQMVEEEKARNEVDPTDPSTWPEDAPQEEGTQTMDGEDQDMTTAGQEGNKFEIEIPDLVDGKRPFEEVKRLYEELSTKAGVDNSAYDTLVRTKFPQFQKYRTKDDFCYMAETSEINELLNSI